MPESFNKLVNFSTFLYCEYLKVRGALFTTINPFIILIIIIVMMMMIIIIIIIIITIIRYLVSRK